MKKILLPVVLLLSLQTTFAQDKKAKSETLVIEMVNVKGGQFDLGDDSAAMDRRPAHSVTLHDFSIGKYEITQKQWYSVMGSNPSPYNYCDNCPVTNVSWNDIQAFLEKINAMSGKHYRLPTEAEWEFAARGGRWEKVKTKTYNDGGSDEEYMMKHSGREVLQYVAWFERNSNDHEHPVGKKRANMLNIYDMSGNVEEWCNDWYGKSYFSAKDVTNPTGPDGGSSKVVRGGSWKSLKDEISVTRRAAYTPDTKATTLGFRIAE